MDVLLQLGVRRTAGRTRTERDDLLHVLHYAVAVDVGLGSRAAGVGERSDRRSNWRSICRRRGLDLGRCRRWCLLVASRADPSDENQQTKNEWRERYSAGLHAANHCKSRGALTGAAFSIQHSAFSTQPIVPIRDSTVNSIYASKVIRLNSFLILMSPCAPCSLWWNDSLCSSMVDFPKAKRPFTRAAVPNLAEC